MGPSAVAARRIAADDMVSAERLILDVGADGIA